MRHLLKMSWWIFLLVSLEMAASFLDSFHHLVWGWLGIHLVKAGYLGCAIILFIRYRSFRRQRSYESMEESYKRLAGQEPVPAQTPNATRKSAWTKSAFYLGLLILSLVDFLLVIDWNESTYRLSIGLDFGVWLLALWWIARVHWLKSLGRKERLKEVLDDARSRHRPQGAEVPSFTVSTISKAPFLVLGLLVLTLSVVTSGLRWKNAERIYRIDDLQACMQKCFALGTEQFYQQGQLEGELAKQSCLEARKSVIHVTMGFHAGELFLRAKETASADFFGNGVQGDEGLILDATGRFRKATAEDL